MDDVVSRISEQPQKKKPSARILILAGLHLVQSLALLGFGIYMTQTSGWMKHVIFKRAFQFMPLPVFDAMVSGIFTVILAVLGLIIAIALMRVAAWAWMAAMVLQGLGLLAGIYGYFQQRPNYLGMAISIFLVFYLNLRDVRVLFRKPAAGSDLHI